MELGFYNASYGDQAESVSINALRGQAMKRLAGVEQRLNAQGVGTAFTRAASRPSLSNDSGLLGALIFDMILCGAMSACMGADFSLGHESGAAGALAIAGMESLSLLRDQEAEGYRSRRLNDYPEGRRRSAQDEAAMSKKFNMVSANQNNRFSFNAQAEVACMFEILDMLDGLEKEGVKMIRFSKKQGVYNVLKQATKKIYTKDAIKTFAAPMRKAV